MSKPRVVVITGGGSGMGQSTAWRFAKNGDTVYVLGRRLEKLQETAQNHPEIKTVQADATDIASVEKATKQILKTCGKIDVLINCAGGNIKVDDGASPEEEVAAFKQIVDINLTTVFNVITAFTGNINPGGRIINVTSMAAINGSRQGGVAGQAYAAAKSGVHGLSRTLVPKFSADNITINCVAPGVIADTEFFPDKTVPEALTKHYLPKTPMNRLGKPNEIAAGIFYLASDEAGFVTGEILNINGGIQFGR